MNTIKRNGKMALGCFASPPGHHLAAWRFEGVNPGACVDFSFYVEMVKKLEDACFNFFFLSDGVGIRTHYDSLESLSQWGRIVQFEPITLMSALAAVTKKIGLVATASTSYNEPFNIARKYASLDILSQGRIAWNIVTSVTDAEAQNFNRDTQLAHADRYSRAEEFLEVVTGLWDSWDHDAFIHDKEKGRFFDPNKARILNYKGQHFQVKGPLNVPRSPQGRPVLVQAGSSDRGIEFAAKWAEVIFTAQDNIEDAKKFRHRVLSTMEKFGRNSDCVKIMPGLMLIIGESKEDAYEKLNKMQSLVPEQVGLDMLKGQLGDIDLSGYDLDKPLPDLPMTNGSISRQALLLKKAKAENLTLRQLMNSVSVGRGHHVLVGSAQMIADTMEQWFLAGAADGFNIMPSHLPEGLDLFIQKVLPLLKQKELVQIEYPHTMLRDNLGFRKY